MHGKEFDRTISVSLDTDFISATGAALYAAELAGAGDLRREDTIWIT